MLQNDVKDFIDQILHYNEWMNEWAFIVTYTEVQAKLQQSTRPYIYNIQYDKGVDRT